MLSYQKSSVSQELQKQIKSLRDALKASGPSDKEVEFERQSLRRKYLGLVFKTDERGRKSRSQTLAALNSLWFETTHAFIHAYRQRVSALDDVLSSSKPQSKGKSKSNKSSRSSPPPPGPTARRRLIQAFRNFLAAEETFWSHLLAKLVHVFDVQSAFGVLRSLGIPGYDSNDDSTIKITSLPSKATKEICHKVLVFYGDLARYKELYSETSRPNNDNAKGKRRDGNNNSKKRDRSSPYTSQNWAKANEAYYQARLLIPENGNPSNQLAVLAQYQQDTLSSIYWYFRALTAVQPFDTARGNLDLCFNRALTKHRPKGDDDSIQNLLKHDFIVLQGTIFLHQDMDRIPELLDSVVKLLSRSIIERFLPSEVILKIIVLSISSWWDYRMQKIDGPKSQQQEESGHHTTATKSSLHQNLSKYDLPVFEQVIRLISTLFTSSSSESVSVEVDNVDLGQTVSAILRRCLPAIRVSLQWIIRNLSRLAKAQTSIAVANLWQDLATFANKLIDAFPLDKLESYKQDGEVILEENIDMSGFAPLRMSPREDATTLAEKFSQTHPNEEQLLRISDILNTIILIASMDESRIYFDHEKFTVQGNSVNRAKVSKEDKDGRRKAEQVKEERKGKPEQGPDDDDEEEEEDGDNDDISLNISHAYSAELDPVDLAMRATTGGLAVDNDDSEEDDQVLYRPKFQSSNLTAPTLSSSPPLEQQNATTASDVLFQLLNGDPTTRDAFVHEARRESSIPNMHPQYTSPQPQPPLPSQPQPHQQSSFMPSSSPPISSQNHQINQQYATPNGNTFPSRSIWAETPQESVAKNMMNPPPPSSFYQDSSPQYMPQSFGIMRDLSSDSTPHRTLAPNIPLPGLSPIGTPSTSASPFTNMNNNPPIYQSQFDQPPFQHQHQHQQQQQQQQHMPINTSSTVTDQQLAHAFGTYSPFDPVHLQQFKPFDNNR